MEGGALSRPSGARNADYHERRAELIARIERRLISPPDHPPMSVLAKAAGVSIPTMKHYFGDRAGVIDAVLRDGAERGVKFMAVAAEPAGDFSGSLQQLAAFVIQGWRRGRLGNLHAIGFAEAQRQERPAATYLDGIMDPMIDAVAARLQRHMEQGDMQVGDARHAAIGFLGPLFLALMHQVEFGGAQHRPLDLDALARSHAEAFTRAHRA